MDRAVVLLSGGIDSVTLLHVVKGEIDVPHVIALSFDYGQKHSRELEAAKFQAEDAGAAEHRIVDISGLGGLFAGSALTDAAVTVPDLSAIDEHRRAQPPTYVPNRNRTSTDTGTARKIFSSASIPF
jgi:7-cyano-7-deazaguanine synthase